MERGLKLGQVVDGTTDGPDVYFEVVGLLLDDLGREVEWGPDSGIVLEGSALHDFGDAEVAELDLPSLGEEDVEAFDVSVDDVLRVEVFHAHADLVGKVPNVLLCKVLLLLPLVFEHLSQFETSDRDYPVEVTLFGELHHDVDGIVLDERVVVPLKS